MTDDAPKKRQHLVPAFPLSGTIAGWEPCAPPNCDPSWQHRDAPQPEAGDLLEMPQDFVDYIGTRPCGKADPIGDCCRIHECWFGNPGMAYRAGYAYAVAVIRRKK